MGLPVSVAVTAIFPLSGLVSDTEPEHFVCSNVGHACTFALPSGPGALASVLSTGGLCTRRRRDSELTKTVLLAAISVYIMFIASATLLA